MEEKVVDVPNFHFLNRSDAQQAVGIWDVSEGRGEWDVSPG